MIKQQSGKIILFPSIYGREEWARIVPYFASKGGIHNLTHALAKDKAVYKVNGNVVALGTVKTPVQRATRKRYAAAEGGRHKNILNNLLGG